MSANGRWDLSRRLRGYLAVNCTDSRTVSAGLFIEGPTDVFMLLERSCKFTNPRSTNRRIARNDYLIN